MPNRLGYIEFEFNYFIFLIFITMEAKDEQVPQEGNTNNDQNSNKEYEILSEDHPNYDLSFKVIVIGNSGKYYYIFIIDKNK